MRITFLFYFLGSAKALIFLNSLVPKAVSRSDDREAQKRNVVNEPFTVWINFIEKAEGFKIGMMFPESV